MKFIVFSWVGLFIIVIKIIMGEILWFVFGRGWVLFNCWFVVEDNGFSKYLIYWMLDCLDFFYKY